MTAAAPVLPPVVAPVAITGLGSSKLAEDGKKSTVQFVISRLVQVYYALGWLAAFTVPFSWKMFGVCVALYWVRMWFITAGYHRYFSHKTFKTSRAFQFFLAFMAETSVQQGVCWWAAHHRSHHKQCDTINDPHSPSRLGFWKSHMLWIEQPENYETHWENVKDLMKFPEIVWISEFFLLPPALLGFALYLWGGLPAFVWGFVVSTWAVSHSTFLVNSANHIWGTERFICQYQKGCTAKNNWWVTVFTLGEGWHNNHHANMAVCRQGLYWYEIDITYYVLRALQALGLVWDIREPDYDGVERRKEEFRKYKAGLADGTAQPASASAPADLLADDDSSSSIIDSGVNSSSDGEDQSGLQRRATAASREGETPRRRSARIATK